MNQHPQLEHKPTEPPKDRTTLFIGLMVLFLGVIIFFYYQNRSLKETQAIQAKELSETLLQLDSISNELDEKIATISELGGQVDTLIKIKEKLQLERSQLLTEMDNRKDLISTLRGKVGGYQELLLEKDEEITRLKAMNHQLITENKDLKTETQQLNQSLKNVHKEKEQLAEQVAYAARLKVNGLKVYAISDNGKERLSEFRSRHIEKLKITFMVAENKVAPIEGKELLIRIVGPDGNVLFDVTRGSGTFLFNNREMFYSAKQEILYDKKSQQVTVFYTKGSEYAAGQHRVEVYTDDYLMGEGTFLVK